MTEENQPIYNQHLYQILLNTGVSIPVEINFQCITVVVNSHSLSCFTYALIAVDNKDDNLKTLPFTPQWASPPGSFKADFL